MDPQHNQQFVGRNSYLDYRTENLLRGSELRDEMRVLIESPDFRPDSAKAIWPADEHYQMMKFGRWCKVTKLNREKIAASVEFVGLYDDGTQMPISVDPKYHWFVKKNSIRVDFLSPESSFQEQKSASSRYKNFFEELPPETAPNLKSVAIKNVPQETDWTQQNPHGAGSPEDSTIELPKTGDGQNNTESWYSKRPSLEISEEQLAAADAAMRGGYIFRTETSEPRDTSEDCRDLTEVAKKVREEHDLKGE